MSSTKYLTQFICICVLCDRETMAFEIDGKVTAECNMCDNRRTFSRPRTRPEANVMIRRFEGYFKVDHRYDG